MHRSMVRRGARPTMMETSSAVSNYTERVSGSIVALLSDPKIYVEHEQVRHATRPACTCPMPTPALPSRAPCPSEPAGHLLAWERTTDSRLGRHAPQLSPPWLLLLPSVLPILVHPGGTTLIFLKNGVRRHLASGGRRPPKVAGRFSPPILSHLSLSLFLVTVSPVPCGPAWALLSRNVLPLPLSVSAPPPQPPVMPSRQPQRRATGRERPPVRLTCALAVQMTVAPFGPTAAGMTALMTALRKRLASRLRCLHRAQALAQGLGRACLMGAAVV